MSGKGNGDQFRVFICIWRRRWITYSFSEGWRKIHNPRAGSDVTDKLTTTEFAVAMLAARGWTNQEICDHMDISLHTVKYHISSILRKLDITKRSELKRYMLQ